MKFASPWADFERDGVARIKALDGHEVYKLTDAQLDEWRKASAPLVGQWLDRVRKDNVDGDAALKALKDAVGKYNAGS